MTTKEKEHIKTFCEARVSEETQLSEIPEEFRALSLEFREAIPLIVFKLCHFMLHEIQDETEDCITASNSLVLKVFILGYTCRKAMEENEKLAELIPELFT